MGATNEPVNGLPMLAYRLDKAEREIDLKADKDALISIAEDVKGIRKLFLSLIATIGGSAVVFAFTILEILANKH